MEGDARLESDSAAQLRYRPDIDGLRALAIVPVVLYHLDLIGGGLVGVDVFFVISGFLIARLLSADLDVRGYSVAGFYVRRVRRIFPALFIMLLVVSGAMAVLALPRENVEFRNSLAATGLFASNIFFYLTDSYFGPAATARPLIHTWSLAVEEQFYIVFPLLLWLLRRKTVRWERWILAALALASLGWSTYLSYTNPSAAFYLPLGRAWELLLGALLALGAIPELRQRVLAEGASALGILLIVASAVLVNQHWPFPGIGVLPACLGAAMIIAAGRNRVTLGGRLLAFGPVRLAGLISYSWYLWHWPLISLPTYIYGIDKGTTGYRMGVLVGSALFGWLSWRFVERPFRHHVEPGRNPVILGIAAGLIAVQLGIAGLLVPVSAAYWNVTPDAKRAVAVLDYDPEEDAKPGHCLMEPYSKLEDFDQKLCLSLDAQRKNYLLIGDSHAARLWPGFGAVDPGINVLQATSSRCVPVMGKFKGSPNCKAMREFLFKTFIPTHHFDEIVLDARWTKKSIKFVVETAQALRPYADRVVIFGPIVEYDHSLPRTVAVIVLRHDPSVADLDRRTNPRKVDRQLAKQTSTAGLPYFSVYDAICPNDVCTLVDGDGLPIQFDYGHLTASGAAIVVRRAREVGMF